MINIEQLKTKDEFNELNEKLEDPSEKANLVINKFLMFCLSIITHFKWIRGEVPSYE